MTTALVSWALGQNLKPTAKLLLVTGCHMAAQHENGAHFFDPTIDELAARCGVTRMTVFATIRKLEKAGLLRVERFPGDRNVYLPQMGAGAKQ
ncbi:MarR family protein [Paraburkholderia steynii]|uniref:MarR family protein n=1 Tax=Paraburkholderia steynii TaxID=1245441 RepID=A0A7Z7BBY1_9BURK|nr:helix-turn-helix domain-containing protein [Paraburkholderia steynii]SDI64896.1 MarR family protein [Paraburkholderia steynii]